MGNVGFFDYQCCESVLGWKYVGKFRINIQGRILYASSAAYGILFIQVDVQGPVVQSVVSLTSSLRVILLTVLADSIHNTLIFFAEKM